MASSKTYGSIGVVNEEVQSLTSNSRNNDTTDRQQRLASWLAGIVILVILCVLSVVLFHPFRRAKSNQIPPKDPEYWYTNQAVDHFAKIDTTQESSSQIWSQRYYKDDSYFGGPGHPIFVIIGGEDAVDGILYPFVRHHLALQMEGYTFCLEHRFFGESQPVATTINGGGDDNKSYPTNEQLQRLLTPAQALEDLVQFIQDQRQALGCSLTRGDETYCPVVTVGGSYPGFLSALMRLVYPDVVDVGYASSAPLHLYSHQPASLSSTTNGGDVKLETAYFDTITAVADRALPGCAAAVRETLATISGVSSSRSLSSSPITVTEAAEAIGICTQTVPTYIETVEVFWQEVIMIVATHFAESNMDYYPPGPDTLLYQNCRIFLPHDAHQSHDITRHDAYETLRKFLSFQTEDDNECFDMQTELPPGKHGTISASDWSGVGSGDAGFYWDVLSCILLPQCGFSSQSSMFPDRPWTLPWITDHCETRFGVTPDMDGLLDQFHFENLANASNILFTNGLNDGWSALSVLTQEDEISDSIKVLNFENGAHHSDLQHIEPNEKDTADLQQGFIDVRQIIRGWLTK